MAVDGILTRLPGALAGEDFTSSANLFVKPDPAADYQFLVCDSAGEAAIGVAYTNPSVVGSSLEVVVTGLVKVKAGAAIANGAEVATAADGEVVTAVTTDVVLGTCMNTVSGAGVMAEVLMIGQHIKP